MKNSYLRFLVPAALFIVLSVIAVGWLFCTITATGEQEELVEADVIIVLGAAVWPQGPSPALQARVYRGVQLYQEGLAPYLLMTGGLGKYPPAEAEAMAQAAQSLGVPPEAIIIEPEATNTAQNMAYSQAIMADNNWETALVVSDTWHMHRALLLAKDVGIEAYPAPAKNSVLYRNRSLRYQYTLREVLAIIDYYQRLPTP